MGDREEEAQERGECCDGRGRWTVGAHRREAERRLRGLGKDSYIVTSKLGFEGCQSISSPESIFCRRKLHMENLGDRRELKH